MNSKTLSEFEWALTSEHEIKDQIHEAIESAVMSNLQNYVTQTSIEETQNQLNGEVSLFSGDVDITGSEFILSDIGSMGLVKLNNARFPGDINLQGSEVAFLGENNFFGFSSNKNSNNTLTITLKPNFNGKCSLFVPEGAKLKISGELKVYVEDEICQVVLGGVIEAKLVNFLYQGTENKKPKFVFYNPKDQLTGNIDGFEIINFGNLSLLNLALKNVGKLENHGQLRSYSKSYFIKEFLNGPDGVVTFDTHCKFAVRGNFINYGVIKIIGDSMILSSLVGFSSLIEKAWEAGKNGYSASSVMINFGKIESIGGDFLTKILGFNLVVNGPSGYISGIIEINMPAEGSRQNLRAMVNLGGEIIGADKSIFSLYKLLNFPSGNPNNGLRMR